MKTATLLKSLSKVQSDVKDLTKRRAELLSEVSQIDSILGSFQVPAIPADAKTPRKASSSSGKRAGRGMLTQTLEAVFADKKGKITTKDAITAFEKAGIATAANAVLMRLKKKGDISNPERGIWVRKSKAA